MLPLQRRTGPAPAPIMGTDESGRSQPFTQPGLALGVPEAVAAPVRSLTAAADATASGQVPSAKDAVRTAMTVALAPTGIGWLDRLIASERRGGLINRPNITPASIANEHAIDMATNDRMAAEAAKPKAVTSPSFEAYHGSSYTFDQFDASKIGTGEGAQAYGHGLYFAENEGVARSYKAANQPSYLGSDRADAALKLLKDAGGDRATAMSAAQQSMSNTTKYSEGKLWQDVINNFDDLVKRGPGSMYQTRVNADPSKFLHWDKPLSEQSPDVQKALEPLLEKARAGSYLAGRNLSSDATGETLYQQLGTPSVKRALTGDASGFSDKANASKILQDAGIPGIKYLDQGSRNAGDWHITPPTQTVSGKWMVKNSDYNSQGMHFDTEAEAKAALAEKQSQATHNYVLFDPKHVQILKRYAIPAAVGAGIINSQKPESP